MQQTVVFNTLNVKLNIEVLQTKRFKINSHSITFFKFHCPHMHENSQLFPTFNAMLVTDDGGNDDISTNQVSHCFVYY